MTAAPTFDSATIDTTGDVVKGDTIAFAETVFGGSFRRPRPIGERRILAVVESDSYGAAKQQHTFTLRVLASDGVEPLQPGSRTTRKGRNVYRNGVKRQPWPCEADRRAALNEKHERGDRARAERDARKAEW